MTIPDHENSVSHLCFFVKRYFASQISDANRFRPPTSCSVSEADETVRRSGSSFAMTGAGYDVIYMRQ